MLKIKCKKITNDFEILMGLKFEDMLLTFNNMWMKRDIMDL